MKEHRASFRAHGDDGREYSVIVYVDVLTSRTFGRTETTEGLMDLCTVEGEAVNRLEKGKYQIVQTGVILTSDALEAP